LEVRSFTLAPGRWFLPSMLCHVRQLGLMGYAEALQLQQELVTQRKAKQIPDTLILLEHPHVYTLGRNASREHLLFSVEKLQTLKAQVCETDRGGDVTYHGPGQLVGYPIFDLAQHRRDVSWYMRSLEEVFIGVARDYGIQAGRLAGAPGVWIGNEKLVAMGVHLSRWVTSHGFALNVNTDLSYFNWIVPCGLADKGVTSLAQLLGKEIPLAAVIEKVIENFGKVFGFEMEVAGEIESQKLKVGSEG
jgi:lipoyl(octanoyl) transferase